MKAYGSYGLLLGTVLTAVYGYTAQAAMARDLDRVRVEAAAPVVSPVDNRIWYGGVLAPITVTGWRPQAALLRRVEADG